MILLVAKRLVAIIVLWSVAVMGVGCANQKDGGELSPAGEVQPYREPWQYRYGDSPRLADGSFQWADPHHDDGNWVAAAQTMNPPGRRGNDYLWLRTRLAGPVLQQPAWQVNTAYQSCEVYLDGRKVFQFGQLEGPLAARFAGQSTLTIPLSRDYRGKPLVLRIYSPHHLIGIGAGQLLGDSTALLVELVHRGLSLAVLGLMCLILAMSLLVVSFIRWGKTQYLISSFTFLCSGVYITSRSTLRSLLFESPTAWYYIELGSLCLAMLFATALQQSILVRGRSNVFNWGLRWTWRIFLAYFVGAALLLLFRLVHLANLLLPLQWLILLSTVGLTVGTWSEFRRGSIDVRIFAAGLAIAFVSIMLDLGRLWHLFRGVGFSGQYAAVGFLGSLCVILGRRFRAFNQRLADYSTVLKLSLSSAQDLTPGHQAQIALAELVRMLRARRGLLFLCSRTGNDLKLVAGRDVEGGALFDLAAHGGYDAKLLGAVLQHRRPFVRELVKRSAGTTREREARRSAVAAPLTARGQLLGAIYLEGDEGGAAFDQEDVELLLGLVVQVVLTLMATRAGRLESERIAAHHRLVEQGNLLQAAARMARGDLESPITVDPASELYTLSQMLDRLRLEIRAKVKLLESGNAAVRQLNQELRLQLEGRLRRLLDFAQQREQKTLGVPMPRASAAGFLPGELLVDHYQIVRLLGEGMSGSVYEVKRTTDGRALAAKVLSKRATNTDAAHFAREAQILACLHHPNVISIVDVDLTDQGLLFLVTELIRGTPLSRCQERYGDPQFALAVLTQIAAGLHSIHELGVIHRDLKPANVLVADGEVKEGPPRVKLIDFGGSTPLPGTPAQEEPGAQGLAPLGDLAAERPVEPERMEALVELVGTPMYLAPELAAGARYLGPKADIFSFGIIAYELLSGELPFKAPPIVTRWRGQPWLLPSLRSRIAAGPQAERLHALVEKCLAPDPAQRPNAEQILTVLAALNT